MESSKRFNEGDGESDGRVDVLPPLRSSQNLWASAVVGKDPSLTNSEKDKKFAEGKISNTVGAHRKRQAFKNGPDS